MIDQKYQTLYNKVVIWILIDRLKGGFMADEPSSSSGSTGLDPKVSALLAYLLGIVGGIVFYAISKDSYVRFHSMQSIMLWIVMAVIWVVIFVIGIFIPFIVLIDWLIGLAFFAIWIVLMIKAYGGEKYKLPIIGDMAEKYA